MIDRLNSLASLAFRCRDATVRDEVERLFDVVLASIRRGGKVLVAGNGGSASQASHLAGELLGKYRREARRPLACVDLSAQVGALTCIANDWDYGHIFARQIAGLARAGDVVILLSTSGRSLNIVRAAGAASRQDDVRCVAITGECDARPGWTGKPESLAECRLDAHVRIPSRDVALIQEVSLSVLHSLCARIDEEV